MGISLPLGSGNSGVNDWSDVYNNDSQLVTEFDARDNTYRTLLTARSFISTDAISATYILATNSAIASGTAQTFPTTGGALSPLIYFDDADYLVSSKTQKLRLRAQVAVNATQPNVTFTFGLYPVTVAGGADAITFTTGTVISGSTVAFSAPAASTISQGNSGDFTIPSDGAYTLGVAMSAQLTNNSAVLVSAQLQTRWV